MLKTNSKKAIQNLKAAMVAYCSGWDEDPKTAEEAAKFSEDQAAVKFCAMMWMHGGVSEAFYKLYKGR